MSSQDNISVNDLDLRTIKVFGCSAKMPTYADIASWLAGHNIQIEAHHKNVVYEAVSCGTFVLENEADASRATSVQPPPNCMVLRMKSTIPLLRVNINAAVAPSYPKWFMIHEAISKVCPNVRALVVNRRVPFPSFAVHFTSADDKNKLLTLSSLCGMKVSATRIKSDQEKIDEAPRTGIVFKLPDSITADSVMSTFSKEGSVEEVRLNKTKHGCEAFILFADKSSVDSCNGKWFQINNAPYKMVASDPDLVINKRRHKEVMAEIAKNPKAASVPQRIELLEHKLRAVDQILTNLDHQNQSYFTFNSQVKSEIILLKSENQSFKTGLQENKVAVEALKKEIPDITSKMQAIIDKLRLI